MYLQYGKCSKISNTKKQLFFSTVRNFRNYVSEKKETSDFHGTVSFDPVKMLQQK